MKILSRVERIAYLGVFAALAMIFSYLEFLLPNPLLLPGFKLGLGNVVVLFAAYFLGLREGALLSLVRVLLSALLFGSPTSFLFSLFGAVFAYLSILFSQKLLKNKVSFIGVSILSAACFNVGQILAAMLLYASFSPFFYLSALLLASVVLGGIVGLVLNLMAKRMKLFLEVTA